jgi:hypothetical protein
MNQSVILGGLIAIVSGLLWRKLDGIDKKIDKIADSLNDHKGDFREFKGKVEALLGMPEKKHAEPALEKAGTR